MGEVIYMYRYQQKDYDHETANQLIKEWNDLILPDLKFRRFMLLKILEKTNYNNDQAIRNYLSLVKEIYILSNAIQTLASTRRIQGTKGYTSV